MTYSIESIPVERLGDYASVPISFEVTSRLRLEPLQGGLGGLALVEEPVSPPYVKDYDAQAPDEGPQGWPRIFDVTHWGFFLAEGGGKALGGAAVAWNTNEVNMLEGRRDMAVLWDIRVRPDARGEGIGRALLARAAGWARGRGCVLLKIETQNVNVSACRFYASQGCRLGQIHRHAYAGVPGCEDEVMLCWYLDLL